LPLRCLILPRCSLFFLAGFPRVTVRFFLPGLRFFLGFLRPPDGGFLPGRAGCPGRSLPPDPPPCGVAHRTRAAKLHTLDRTSKRVPAGHAMAAPAAAPALHCTYPRQPAVGKYPVFPRGQSSDPLIIGLVPLPLEEDLLLSLLLADGFLFLSFLLADGFLFLSFLLADGFLSV